MSNVTFEPFVRRQRWISSITLLATMLDRIRIGSNLKLKTTLENGYTGLKQLLDYARQADIPQPDAERELYAFKLECYKVGAASKVKTIPWSPLDETYLGNEVSFEINLMGSLARSSGKYLKMAYNSTDTYGSSAKLTPNSLLYQIVRLSYLSRKVCLLAEQIPNDNVIPLKQSTQEAKSYLKIQNSGKTSFQEVDDSTALGKLVALYIMCQRIRCSSFDFSYSQPLVIDAPTITFQSLKKCFEAELSLDAKPFNKDVHRIRGWKGAGLPPMHEDFPFLDIEAGALKPGQMVDVANSTLGRIVHGLGLPERCDISGTTTDAIGAALYLVGLLKNDNFDPKMYILSCITAMCMAAHHSLDEMGSAASLWSNYWYGPYEANSLGRVLAALRTPEGGNPGDKDVMAWRELIGDKQGEDNNDWYNQKWESFILAKQNLREVRFTDALWKGAQLASGHLVALIDKKM